MKNKLPVLLLIFAALNIGCGESGDPTAPTTGSRQQQEIVDSSPEHDDVKNHSHVIPGVKHGLSQSPINIVTSKIKSAEAHMVEFNYKPSSEDIKNLGHTIEVEYDAGNTTSFDGRTFDFVQFHFHTPSEHLIDGVRYPMEMHMVHTMQGQQAGEETNYLVVSLLFKDGTQNAFLDEFIAAIPDAAGDENVVKGGTVNVNDLLDQAASLSYYHYQGSLTTPPYSETVTWLVVQNIFEASPDQIEKFERLEGHNARHVQALYGRQVDQ